jgi:hypothetical protein
LGKVFKVAKCKVYLGHRYPGYDSKMSGHVLVKTEEELDIGVTMTKLLKTIVIMCEGSRNCSYDAQPDQQSFQFRDRHAFKTPHLESTLVT